MSFQPSLFDTPIVKSGYSYETSLPAFKDVTPARLSNKEKIYQVIIQRKQTCIKEIHDITGLPENIISARMDCLKKEGKARYSGDGKQTPDWESDFVYYKGRNRKKIIAT